MTGSKNTDTLTESTYDESMRWPVLDSNVWRYVEFEEVTNRLSPGVFHTGWSKYGALGDNSTDDTSAILDTLVDAESFATTYGAARVLLFGRHKVTNQIQSDVNGISVWGINANPTSGTALFAYPGTWGTDHAVLRLKHATAFRNGFQVCNLLISASVALTDEVHGLVVGGTKSVLWNVSVEGMTGDGILTGHPGAVAAAVEYRIIACTAASNAGNGFGTEGTTSDRHYVACVSNNNGGAGFAGMSGGDMYIQNHAYTNTNGGFLFNGQGTAIQIIGGKCETNVAGGVVMNATSGGGGDINIEGIRFKDNGRAPNGTSQIWAYRDSGSSRFDDVTVADCTFVYDGIVSDPPLYHVDISAGKNWNVSSGNTFNDVSAAGFVDHIRFDHTESGGGFHKIMGRLYNAGNPNIEGQWSGVKPIFNLIPGDSVWDYINRRTYSFGQDQKFYRQAQISIMGDFLAGYWSLDDVTDAHGSQDLTNNGTVTFDVGVVGNAAVFSGTGQYLSLASPALPKSDIDFAAGCKVKFDTLGSNRAIMGMWQATGNLRAWQLQYTSATNRIAFLVSSDGTNFTVVSADVLGAVSTGVWYDVVGWHSATANQIGITVNGGAANTAAHTTGIFATTASFVIGAQNEGAGSLLDGMVDEAWVTTGYIPFAAERSGIYNSADGRPYSEVVAGWLL